MTGSSQLLHLEALLAQEHSLKALARELLRDEHDAEDLAQQALVRGLERPPAQPASLPSYLARIVRNLALDFGRVSHRRRLREEAAARHESLPSAADMAGREQVRRTVAEVVLSLEEPYRTTVWLRFYEDLPPREIAHRMAVPVNTVRTRLHRALGQMRASLDERHGGKRAAWTLLAAPIAGMEPPSAVPVPAAITGALLMKKGSIVTAVAAVVLMAFTTLLWLDHLPPVARDENVSAAPAAAERPAGSTSPDGERQAERAGPARTPAPMPLPAWRIEGLVREPSGTPVPRAHVTVAARQFAMTHGELGHTLSDAGGRYVVDLTAWRERSPLDLRVISLEVKAWAPAHLPGAEGPTTRPGAPAGLSFGEASPDQEMVLRQDVVLSPGGLLTGRVIDANGTPLKWALIELRADGNGNESGTAVTDVAGEYRLGITDDGPQVIVGSRGDVGWAQERLLLRTGQDQRAPDLVLHPTTRLRGVIVYADGQPVADLEVRVTSERPIRASVTGSDAQRLADGRELVSGDPPWLPSRFPGRGVASAAGRTAADGSFEFRGLQPGKYRLSLPVRLWEDPVRPSTGDSLLKPFRPLVDTEAAENRIVLDSHRLRLRFRDEAGRHLVTSAIVCEGWKPDRTEAIARLAAGADPIAEADASPNVEIHGWGDDFLVPRGSWWCFATGLRGRHRGEATVRAPEHGNESEVVITLREVMTTATLRVHVVSPQGETIAEFGAGLQQTRPGQLCQLEPVSEAAGTRVYRSVPGRYRLRVQPGDFRSTRDYSYSPLTREIVLEDGKETAVTCEAVLCGRLRLTVHLPEGEQVRAIPGFSVTLAGTTAEPAVKLTSFIHDIGNGRDVIASGNPPSGVAATSGQLLEPGPRVLTVQATGYAASVVPVLIRAGEITDAEVRLIR